MANYAPISNAAKLFERSTRSIESLISRRLINAYKTADGTVLVDCDQIEAAIREHPDKVRDTRLVAGVRPIPLTAIVGTPVVQEAQA